MGTRTKILTAATAVLALALAVPVAAQDTGPQVAITYVDTEVDGPISDALATFATTQGHDVTAGRTSTLAEHWHRITPDCVVVVGKDGDRLASQFADTFDVRAISAQGGDRHETAVRAGQALDGCLS